MKILFKIATRSRRNNFLRAIDSVVKNIADKDSYHILVSVDSDDTTMIPLPVINCPHTYIVFTNKEGEEITKISAINRDVNDFKYDWDILVNLSDDQVFTERDFDDIIRKSFFKKVEWTGFQPENHLNPYDLDQFIHFPDGNRNDLCTMSIIGRDYYERDGYIYHPEYKSLFCDDEAMQVAKIRGCYKYVDKQIFEHKHPAYGKAVFDEQYQKTELIGNTVDRETFIRRKEANFGL